MKKMYALLGALLVLGCNDGDFTTEELDFGDSAVQVCGSYVFYKLSQDKTEALIIYLNTTDPILTTVTETPRTFTINNTSTRVVYRIFDGAVGNNYFCASIPPTAPVVIEEWTAPSGTLQLTNVTEEDDQDGVDRDIEGFASGTDTDGDGLPDYKDDDDDGDNVPTKTEAKKDASGKYQDTDGDGIPDYLDPDDDGDGVLTRNESIDGDTNPTNDLVGLTNTPRYLSAEATESLEVNAYREHTFYIRNLVTFNITGGFILQNGSEEIKFQTESYDFGSYVGSYTESKLTPDF